MELLILVGLVAGIVTALSPCVLPVLPVVLVATTGMTAENGGKANRRRPFIVIAGLVVSFATFTLLGSAVLTLLHLPADLLRWVGIVVLAVAGLGLLWPWFGELIERPFARIPMRKLNRDGGAFTLGLGMGLVFVPCAGPVLAAITVLSATGEIDLRLVALTVSFAVGVSIPLLAFALAGQRIGERIKSVRTRAPAFRRIAGGVLVAMAVAISFNVTDSLQRVVPGYVSAVQEQVENSDAAQDALGSLRGATTVQSFDDCANAPDALANCGTAPELVGISETFNTPGNRPIKLADLKGKVTLVDFWTYSCINCQRTTPTLQKWNETYKAAGLQVIGVHTPEFSFERVPGNVQRATRDLGITYPVAIDNDYETWTAYGNRYWPAHYLIDARGEVRQVHYGEGKHAETESLIRQLLAEANPAVELPAASGEVDNTLTQDRTPETYLGYNRMAGQANPTITEGAQASYQAPALLTRSQFALDGNWTVEPQYSRAGRDARLLARPYAANAFVVAAGQGSIEVVIDGGLPQRINVSGTPRLHKVRSGDAAEFSIQITADPGVQLYALTFG